MKISLVYKPEQIEISTPKEIPICRRCGRKLKSPKSQERGMGDVCAAKSQTEDNHKKLFTSTRL